MEKNNKSQNWQKSIYLWKNRKKILNNYIKFIGGADAAVNDNGQAMVVNNSISEKRIHQEMLSLEELGDWIPQVPAIYEKQLYTI